IQDPRVIRYARGVAADAVRTLRALGFHIPEGNAAAEVRALRLYNKLVVAVCKPHVTSNKIEIMECSSVPRHVGGGEKCRCRQYGLRPRVTVNRAERPSEPLPALDHPSLVFLIEVRPPRPPKHGALFEKRTWGQAFPR